MNENKKGKASKSILIVAVILFAAASIVIAITNMMPSQKPSESNVTSESVPLTQWLQLDINECTLWVDTFNSNVFYDAVTLSSDKPNLFSAGAYTGYDLFVNGTQIGSEKNAEIDLDSLSINNKIEIKLVDQNTGEERCNYVNTLPANYNNVRIIKNGADSGVYYFNLNDYVYKMAADGSILYWRSAGGFDKSTGGNDFKKTVVDGKTYYSFLWGGESSDQPYLTGVDYGRMQALVLDENYRYYDNVQFLIPSDTVGENTRLDNHQFTILGDHHYLLTSYIGRRVYNIPSDVSHSNLGTRVTAAVIQEIKDGQIVFEWDSTDYPELYSLNANADYYNKNEYWTDYLHLDSVAVDPKDNNIILSFANADSIVKINHSTGKIMWILGGSKDEFGLSETQKFSGQNDVRINKDGTLTMFNNGTLSKESSVIRLELNEKDKRLITFEEYKAEGTYSSSMGSAEFLDEGKYVICWGKRETASSLFSEIDFKTNTVLFEVIKPSDDSCNSYRVYKFDN